MRPQRPGRPSPPLWIVTTAATLLGAAGFAVLISTSLAGASRSARPILSVEVEARPAERLARRTPRCAECGLIESISASGSPAGSAGREITVRLQDGSSRVIVDPNPATWRRGERVVVIDGLVGPGG